MRDNFNHSCVSVILLDTELRNGIVCGCLKGTWWHENRDQQTSFYDGSGPSNSGNFLSVVLKWLPEITIIVLWF